LQLSENPNLHAHPARTSATTKSEQETRMNLTPAEYEAIRARADVGDVTPEAPGDEPGDLSGGEHHAQPRPVPAQ
jgi:hypothetical protein